MATFQRILYIIVFFSFTFSVQAEKFPHQHKHNMDHSAQQNMTSSDDGRISLNLSEQMKQHQLANMRAHLVAIQNIVGMIADNKFEQASEVAHQQLGMTSRMEKMCNSFENEEFKKLGMAFHQSGDELGDILLEKDSAQSLHALHKTMNYCIECHATYRQ